MVDHGRKVVVLCKTCEAGKLICVVLLFLYFVKLKDGVMNIGLCNMSGLRDLCYQM